MPTPPGGQIPVEIRASIRVRLDSSVFTRVTRYAEEQQLKKQTTTAHSRFGILCSPLYLGPRPRFSFFVVMFMFMSQ
jgi:hypothetical protein